MTATWVVGNDGSENARRAMEWAVDQAAGRDVRIISLATWSVPLMAGEAAPAGVMLPDWSDFESAFERSNGALASELSRDGVEIEPRTVQGSAAHTLLEAARDADLLVVGGRGLGRTKGVMLGSVSHRCASNNVVPTAVIGMQAQLGPVTRILVGFDASANARAAAAWALGFAPRDSAVTILDALALAPWLPTDVVRDRFPTEVRAAEEEFEAHMSDVDPDHRATHAFVLADPRVALLDASQDADLVVLGARGRGKLGAMLLGSTTTWMLHDATRATIVVPAPRATSH